METLRIALKTPLYHFPAGSVFEVSAETVVQGWDDDERVRDRQNFSGKTAYVLPDAGRGRAQELSARDVVVCPEHIFDGKNLLLGEPMITAVQTRRENDPDAVAEPPCGVLKEQQVSLVPQTALKRWGIVIDLPPFQEVAEKIVLRDALRDEQVMEYVLRNYSHKDTRLDWDVSDLRPGFYELLVCFPCNWVHAIRFVKKFPMLVDPDNIPPAPEKTWQKLGRQILEAVLPPAMQEQLSGGSNDDLRNQALDFCLEWGEMFNKPTQERMMARHPQLTREEADDLDRLAREVRSYVYGLCEQELEGKISEGDIFFEAQRKYPWLSARNINRMKNVGMYYARR